MAFALAVGDVCMPAVYGISFPISPSPPPLGVVTKISPTVVVWQDGTQETYTPSTITGSVDGGLAQATLNFGSDVINKAVRIVEEYPNLNGRAEGIAVLVYTLANFNDPDVDYAVVRLNSNGLYLWYPATGLEIIPNV